jgi:hypothetical protein
MKDECFCNFIRANPWLPLLDLLSAPFAQSAVDVPPNNFVFLSASESANNFRNRFSTHDLRRERRAHNALASINFMSPSTRRASFHQAFLISRGSRCSLDCHSSMAAHRPLIDRCAKVDVYSRRGHEKPNSLSSQETCGRGCAGSGDPRTA